MPFTDHSIKKLKPRATPYRAFEGAALPGFCIQIQPTGSKTFYLQATRNGKRSFYRIGEYPTMPLAAARDRARELLAEIEAGNDPRAKPETAATGTFSALLESWLTHQRERQCRRLPKTEQLIRSNCKHLLTRPAASITSNDIRAILSTVYQRGARVQTNRLRAYLHTIYQYGLRYDHDYRQLHQPVKFGIEINPVAAIPHDSDAEKAGERVLTWAEVREVWNTDRINWPNRQAVRLLLYSGNRVNEIVQAPWSEFDLDAKLWTLPSARYKTKRDLLTPLTPLAVELLTELRDLFPGSTWLFPGRNSCTASAPWEGTSLSKAIRRAGYDWNPRDLRRTWKTLTGSAGLTIDMRDRIQGHLQPGVSAKHYDRHAYLNEKRAALMQWERELRARLAGENIRVFREVG